MKLLVMLAMWLLSIAAVLAGAGVLVLAFGLWLEAAKAGVSNIHWIGVAAVMVAGLCGTVFAAAANPMTSARVGMWRGTKGRLSTIAATTLLGIACLAGGIFTISQANKTEETKVMIDPVSAKRNEYILGTIRSYTDKRKSAVREPTNGWLQAVNGASANALDADYCARRLGGIGDLVAKRSESGKPPYRIKLHGAEHYAAAPGSDELFTAGAIWEGVRVQRMLATADSIEEVERIVATHNSTPSLFGKLGDAPEALVEEAYALTRGLEAPGLGYIRIFEGERQCILGSGLQLPPAS